MAKTHSIPDECPVCKGTYIVSQLRCKNCGTKLEGTFGVGGFSDLDEKQLNFITTFLRNRGNIQNTGKELGISYPTVKSRLDNALKAMNLYVDIEEDVFTRVKNSEISIEEAASILASKKK